LHIRVPFLKDFEVARPQIFAGLMLLALAAATLVLAYKQAAVQHAFLSPQAQAGHVAAPTPQDAVLLTRVEYLTVRGAALLNRLPAFVEPGTALLVLLRVPFILFALWLGGALWWVTRRLYNNAGGYVALALYCSSPLIVDFSSRVNPEIMATWGLLLLSDWYWRRSSCSISRPDAVSLRW
jgi:hypothetical protein